MSSNLCPLYPLRPSEVAVPDGPNCHAKVDFLHNMSCYSYARKDEARRKGSASPSKLFVFDMEVADCDHFEQSGWTFFLLHRLGVLGVRMPREFFERTELVRGSEEKCNKTPTHHLWGLLSSPSNPSLEPALMPINLRYAAYLYYRSRGRIV
uniref:Uncharacterized protein n=1 Tax=Echinococcus canadensis TaxID=519352 RepID=A0A915EYR6_9CEST